VIITVPIVLRALGTQAYGLYVLATLLVGYTAFLDLGLTPSVVRSIAAHHTDGDASALEALIGTALSLLLGLGLIGGAAIALLTPNLSHHWLHVPPRLQADAEFVLYLAAAGFVLNMCLTVFGAVPQGLQRLDLFALRSLLLTTVTGAAQITVVVLGGGLRWLAAVTVLINILSLAVFVLVAQRLIPGLSLLPRFDRWAAGELLAFGALRFVNQLSGQIVFQLDRLIVAAFLTIAAVTFYSVPLSIAQRFVIVQAIFATAFFPAATELHALADRERLKAAYLTSMKLVLVMVIPLTILVAGFSHPLLDGWLGPSFADASAGILAVLAVAYGLAQVMGVPTLAADATGHVHWSAGFAIASAVINLSLTIVLVPRVGAIGAAYALLINSATQGLVFVYLVQRRFVRVSVRTMLGRAAARPLAAGLVLLGYTALLAPRLHGLFAVLIAMALGGAIYLGLTVALRVWDAREIALTRSLLSVRSWRPQSAIPSADPDHPTQ
jgi:O-antigen/teichoic acid export membrane protein